MVHMYSGPHAWNKPHVLLLAGGLVHFFELSTVDGRSHVQPDRKYIYTHFILCSIKIVIRKKRYRWSGELYHNKDLQAICLNGLLNGLSVDTQVWLRRCSVQWKGLGRAYDRTVYTVSGSERWAIKFNTCSAMQVTSWHHVIIGYK